MELSIKDRLYLPSIFPSEGNFVDFNLKKNISQKVSIGEKEAKTIGLKKDEDSDRIIWDTKKETALVADFTSEEKSYMKRCCEVLSDKSLQDDMWILVEKIYNLIG